MPAALAMTCEGPSGSASTSGARLDCSTALDALNATSGSAHDDDPGFGVGVAVEPTGKGTGEADGIRLVVLCACVIAFLLFLYIFGQYIRQRIWGTNSQARNLEGQDMIELPRKMVTMYEAMGDEDAPSPSDRPVLVVNIGSFSEAQNRSVAVGFPEHSGERSGPSEML